MAHTDDNDSSSAYRFSLSSLIPTQHVIIGSVVLIGLLNIYKGLFRFSFGFITGMGIGVGLGFIFAESPLGQYIVQRRANIQQS
jgi:hypothetical protein